MTDLLAKTIAGAGVTAAGVLAVGLPDQAEDWTMLIEKFGVLAFVLVCAVLGLSLLVPKLLDMTKEYLARQDARQDEMRKEFLASLKERDQAHAKVADALDNLTDKINDIRRS